MDGEDRQDRQDLCAQKDGRGRTPEEFSSIPDIVAGIETPAETLHMLAC
ncbi:MAG: hypothetical protein J0H34_16230 [Rhizobiales bacterium]|nr:hypothetical protein [Hyphomicrobiales bacterium]